MHPQHAAHPTLRALLLLMLPLLSAAGLLFASGAKSAAAVGRAPIARSASMAGAGVRSAAISQLSRARRLEPFRTIRRNRRSVISVCAEEEHKEEQAGHQTGKAAREPSEKELRIMQYQKDAPKLSFAEEAKSIITYGNGYGVISTVSGDGYPGGAVVMYAPDENGLPVFSFSTMSTHTQDLLKNSKAAITITTEDFKGAADARVNLVGDIEKIDDDAEKSKLKELFMKKHPNAFWVSFGDFLMFRMTELKTIRFVGGFARAATISAGDYLKSNADPVMAFADKISGHMNEDHQDATKIIIQAEMGLECETAEIKSVDRLGMTVFVTAKQADGTISTPFKLRVGFPEEAPDRVAVRNMLKRMTNEAAAAVSQTS